MLWFAKYFYINYFISSLPCDLGKQGHFTEKKTEPQRDEMFPNSHRSRLVEPTLSRFYYNIFSTALHSFGCSPKNK